MKKNTVIILVILFLFISYIYIFIGKRPFGGEITQDRPIMKMLCEMQMECRAGIAEAYACTEEVDSDWYRRLSRWKDFEGCKNKKTKNKKKKTKKKKYK